MFAIIQNYRILASLHQNALNGSFAFTKPGIDDIKLVDKLYRMEARKNWTDFQDKAISALVKRWGTKNWAEISQKMSSKYGIDMRTGKQCRERWHNHLNPMINKQSWSEKDEQAMFEAHQKHGNKWTLIAALFEGRTDNDIKNHFYSMLRRSLRRINKLLGKRNSTQKIKIIKPAVLSRVFLKDTHAQDDSKKIAQALFQLSTAKTITNLTDSIDLDNKRKFQELIQKLAHYNEEYELAQLKKRESRNSQRPQKVGISSSQDKLSRRNSQPSTKAAKSVTRLRRMTREEQTKPIKAKNKQGMKNQLEKNKQKQQAYRMQAENQKKQAMLLPEEHTALGGYLTRLKKKQSEISYFAGEELNLPPDLFEIQQLHSSKRHSISSKGSQKISKSNSSFSFSPGFTPNSQVNPSFSFTSPNSAGRNWTPLCPSPNFNGIFTRIGDYQWTSNNEDLDAILYQTQKNIQKRQGQ